MQDQLVTPHGPVSGKGTINSDPLTALFKDYGKTPVSIGTPEKSASIRPLSLTPEQQAAQFDIDMQGLFSNLAYQYAASKTSDPIKQRDFSRIAGIADAGMYVPSKIEIPGITPPKVEPVVERTGKSAVNPANKIKEGDVGTYGELKAKSKGSGLEIHEVPSKAAQEKAFVEQYFAENGVLPSPKEIKEFRKGNPSVALSNETHQMTSTYKGKNTASLIAEHASDLESAAKQGAAELPEIGKSVGVNLVESAKQLLKLHSQGR